jgi:peptidoglycan/xylan/chitin deacetylase (PgdA/CDA1 family)
MAADFDIQLHTHRHRAPVDVHLFRREISQNRERILQICGKTPTHFCYPSGTYREEFLPWLKQEGVVSAVTCDTGLATRLSHPLLLPRFIDAASQPLLMFEAWLSGVGQWISGAGRLIQDETTQTGIER